MEGPGGRGGRGRSARRRAARGRRRRVVERSATADLHVTAAPGRRAAACPPPRRGRWSGQARCERLPGLTLLGNVDDEAVDDYHAEREDTERPERVGATDGE